MALYTALVSLSLLLGFSGPAAADKSRAEHPRIAAALAESSAPEVVKIGREIADEILRMADTEPRITAQVLGLFRKAEALDPGVLTPDDAGRVGRLYLRLSESYADEARTYLTRSLAGRDREDERVALGNALLYLGDAAGARREYLKASERRPEDVILLFNLALAERALGDTPSAVARLRRVAANTSDPRVRQAAASAVVEWSKSIAPDTRPADRGEKK